MEIKMWKRTDDSKFATYEKGDVQLSLAKGAVLIAPADENRDDYFEYCDIMMTYIFAYTLYEIIDEGDGGRGLIHTYVTKDEAFWFLGVLGLTMHDKAEIYKMCENK
jgi:hypothetical protein